LDPVVADAVGRELHSRLDRLLGAVQAGQQSHAQPQARTAAAGSPSPSVAHGAKLAEPSHQVMAAYRLSPRLPASRTVLLSVAATTRPREVGWPVTPPATGTPGKTVAVADEAWAEQSASHPPSSTRASQASANTNVSLSPQASRAPPRRSSTGSVGSRRRITAAPPLTPDKSVLFASSSRPGQPPAGGDDCSGGRPVAPGGPAPNVGSQPHYAAPAATSGRRTRSLPSTGVTGGTRRVTHMAPRTSGAVVHERMPSPGMQRVRQY
jgi:hypothetical protein